MMINLEVGKMCASCKYWDDPTRSALKPTRLRGVWDVDMTKRCLCLRKRSPMPAGLKCSYHESKV